MLITGEKIVGVYESYDAAIFAGLEECGPDAAFFVREIKAVDDVFFVPCLV